MTASVCLVQVRRGSTRLHEKMLQKVNGFPLLLWVIERIRLLGVDKVVFCAPRVDENSDFGRILKQNCESNGFLVYWGSENDVASRFIDAVDFFLKKGIIKKPFHLMRVCGDRPFLEPEFLVISN